MASQVQSLRMFRDRTLLSVRPGRAFVSWYYEWSPGAAAWLRLHSFARKLTRAILWLPVAFAWCSLQTNIAFAFIGLVLIIFAFAWSIRRAPHWLRLLCLVVVAIGIASAHDCESPSTRDQSHVDVSIARGPQPHTRRQNAARIAGWQVAIGES